MAQYLLSVWHDDTNYEMDVNSDDVQRMFGQVANFNSEVQAAGAWVFGGGLNPPPSATVVRSTDGDVSMTDGPYAESKEQMGGFWIIEADDLDSALEWARKGSAACEGPVEVRPFQDESG
ncbi:MAG TPA: YciI family protein [Microthrixaceae bacterium]|nr:YciI family protein [Microthrixaceae bacterium]